MTTLDELLAREADIQNTKAKLSLQMQELDDLLPKVRVCIAEARDVNRHAVTYNIPNETLSAIFEAGLSDLVDPPITALPFEPSPTIPFEFHVSAISRRWRNIALSTPRLWTRLHINVLKSTEDDLIDLYLFRSKTCLLDIVSKTQMLLHGGVDPYADVAARFQQHLERLLPHVTRWRKLVIVHNTEPTTLSPLAHLHVPALETIMVQSQSYFGNQQSHMMDMFSGGAPRLSSVEIQGTYFWLPRDAVTSLKLGVCSFPLSEAQFRRFMLPMRSLTHLCLHSTVCIDPIIGQPSIQLSSLLSLELHLVYMSLGALRLFDLPAVRTLTVHGITHNMIEAFSQHHVLYPTLQSLTVITTQPRTSKICALATKTLDFISLFPGVREVVFQGADSTAILHALQDGQSADVLLWAELSKITIRSSPQTTIAVKKQIWTLITKLVTSRFQRGHPISQIELSETILERCTPKQRQRLEEQVVLVESQRDVIG
jgi:hypothetical protein